MDTKQYVHIEVTKGDHTFSFKMPLGCTWGQAVDASFEVATHVSKLANEVITKSTPDNNPVHDATPILDKGE